jgi:hypothetical protein
VRGLRARIGQRPDQRIDAPLAAFDLWARRQLGPVQLQDLAGAIAGALRGALALRAQLAQAALDEVDRALIAALAQDLGHARRFDRRPLLEHLSHDRLEGIEL